MEFWLLYATVSYFLNKWVSRDCVRIPDLDYPLMGLLFLGKQAVKIELGNYESIHVIRCSIHHVQGGANQVWL